MKRIARYASALSLAVGTGFFVAPFVLYETPFAVGDGLARTANFLYVGAFLISLSAHNLYRLTTANEYNVGGFRVSTFLGCWAIIAAVIVSTFAPPALYLLGAGGALVAFQSMAVCLVHDDSATESTPVQPAD